MVDLNYVDKPIISHPGRGGIKATFHSRDDKAAPMPFTDLEK